MTRHNLVLALLAVAALCFGLVLASILGSDFDVNEPAFLAGGFLATTAALFVERFRG